MNKKRANSIWGALNGDEECAKHGGARRCGRVGEDQSAHSNEGAPNKLEQHRWGCVVLSHGERWNGRNSNKLSSMKRCRWELERTHIES